jgi:hypothetical protein
MEKVYRGPYIDAYCQVWFHFNNSKTVNNIRNLAGIKMISTARSNYPEILKKI